MTTYTYPINGSDTPVSGLSAHEVAIARLTYDGHDFGLRHVRKGEWQLFVSAGGANSCSGLGEMVAAYSGPDPYGELLISFEKTKEAAWAELAPLIALAEWDDVPEAMTDDDYRQMISEL
jgi:hypothetical protein